MASAVQRFGYRAVFLLTFVVAGTSIHAAPRASLVSDVYDFGELPEGETTVIHSTFEVRNTGSSNLLITNVRPDCGCTMVGYDTIIPPGKTGYIKPKVDIEGYTQGAIEKHISITTNDSSNQAFELTIKGTIKPIIGYSPEYINLNDGASEPFELKLTTSKADLKIMKVSFSSENEFSDNWRTKLPLYVSVTQGDTRGPDARNLYEYSVFLSNNLNDKEYRYGTFVIETNHPEKQNLAIGGTVNGG